MYVCMYTNIVLIYICCICKRLGLVGVLVVCEECSLGKLIGLLLLFCSPLLLTNTDSFAQVAGIVQDTFSG